MPLQRYTLAVLDIEAESVRGYSGYYFTSDQEDWEKLVSIWIVLRNGRVLVVLCVASDGISQ